MNKQERTRPPLDQQKATATLTGNPSPSWTGNNWYFFAGLSAGLVVIGALFFFLVPHRGVSSSTAIAYSSPGPNATMSSTATKTNTSELAIMVTVTPFLVDTETAVIAEPTDSPTATPVPTSTFTPTPSETPSPIPTNTNPPTATTAPPTQTPTQTGTPTRTPTMTPSPSPTLSYPSPQLLEPKSGQYFSGAETRIELRWTPVGALKDDEWYGLSLKYRHSGENVETGAWIKETSWVVPNYLAGQADEPDRRYEWGVVVVKEIGRRVDGSREGREISPRSETWHFVWR